MGAHVGGKTLDRSPVRIQKQSSKCCRPITDTYEVFVETLAKSDISASSDKAIPPDI